ncbi:MAG: PEP-CTERM sorting domain-containing protein [Dissulfurispiraceae bacterium]
MKRITRITTATVFLISLCIAVSVQAYVINDTYWGGTPSSGADADVIGTYTQFGINTMTVTQSGNQLTVDINGPFFNAYTFNDVYNMQLGSLFLSTTGWQPYGTGPTYPNDTTLNTGTNWAYAFVLNGKKDATSGSGSLYNVLSSGIILTNTTGIKGAGLDPRWKEDQLYRYTPGTSQSALGSGGTWSISGNDLIMTFDISPLTPGNLAFDWTMQCGNDVIEGPAPSTVVPEPGTLVLFGTGLAVIGLFGLRRNRKASN